MVYLNKKVNVVPKLKSNHPQLLEHAKEFFIHDNQSYITEHDLAYFAGWLVANIKNPQILDSLKVGIEVHEQIISTNGSKNDEKEKTA